VLYKYIIITLLVLMNSPSMASSTLPVIVQTPKYSITAEPTELPIILNKIHSWIIHIDDTTGQPVQGLEFQIKGGMPAHQHGLPTQPLLINEPKPGEYIVDGMKFNMYGAWIIELIDLNPDPKFHQKIEFDLDHTNAK
jgi:YtkA-like protein